MATFEWIPATGLTVIYTPEGGAPLVDIVLVHGLKGHPYKTWTAVQAPDQPKQASAPTRTDETAINNERKRRSFRGVMSQWKKSLKVAALSKDDEASVSSANGTEATCPRFFWPGDLLHKDCREARILTYGYDSKITKYMHGGTNNNGIYSHSKDFLFSLQRDHVRDRPLIFLAHSLGGIVVKEMLSQSSTSASADVQNIVESTKSVIFLGTPHRGSQDLSALVEWARSVLSILRMETTSAVLDTLGLKTTDLERAQESFSALWTKYQFQVKTFQEGLSLTGVNLGVLGNKVVPDYSSLIGDHRERAETLQANHMEMFGNELRSVFLSIARSGKKSVLEKEARDWLTNCDIAGVTEAEAKACLRALAFPGMNSRLRSIDRPALQTSRWVFQHESYKNWILAQNWELRQGLLFLKGKPGTGKSTVMKEAFRQTKLLQMQEDISVAAFFFNAKGGDLEHSPVGLYRSLLHQLLLGCPTTLREACQAWDQKDPNCMAWTESELRDLVRAMLSKQLRKRTVIFIDALDECDDDDMRPMAYFWRDLTTFATLSELPLRVCISLRHFPTITICNCLHIAIEEYNLPDISTYVDQKLELGMAAADPQWARELKQKVLAKSNGVFLWVTLVINGLLRHWDEGKGLRYLHQYVNQVPGELEDLFDEIIGSVEPNMNKPLRLHEWHHILAFVKQPKARSLEQWRQSVDYTETDEQLEREIRRISKGLLELSTCLPEDDPDEGFESLSLLGGAGSLDHKHGETRVVQVIHESVRKYFMDGDGFKILKPNSWRRHTIVDGHLSIAKTCLDYLFISELDALVIARERRTCKQQSQEWWNEAILHKPDESNMSRGKEVNVIGRSQQLGGQSKLEFERVLQACKENLNHNVLAWIDYCAQSFENPPSLAPEHGLTRGITMSVHDSAPSTSGTGRSQVLSDHPALLPYAISQLFSHMRRAHFGGVEISSIVDQLKDGRVWNRFVALKEDLPPGITLESYLEVEVLAPGSYDSESEGSEDIRGKEGRKSKRRYRSHSIASFSSASSFSSTRES
ncbi:hypothetical protein B0T10DRAFT_573048 [Thelonectria olida]|uniref:Nephrocystin 3-like N-terminal domain-containing protein n=1 Tax=Thelonectria olida TaxID=1576542 RepID=A0A9P9AIY6_9HYPO|nr:hypothetical protein B0T10DRAFT_573048 [Thelonectria olida]